MNAIPTKYAGVQFRSRLEARWAAMFDLLGWRWEYEPVDLEGYIPDFVLMAPAGGVLVEIKPGLASGVLHAATPKVDRSGWETPNENAALILGATCDLNLGGSDLIPGLVSQPHDTDPFWDNAAWHDCTVCPSPSLCHQSGSYTCVMCGYYDGHCGTDHPEAVRERWVESGNAVQWKPRR